METFCFDILIHSEQGSVYSSTGTERDQALNWDHSATFLKLVLNQEKSRQIRDIQVLFTGHARFVVWRISFKERIDVKFTLNFWN